MIAFPDRFTPPPTGDSPTPIHAGEAKRPSDSNLPEIGFSDRAATTENLGDEIARLAAHIHAATYQLLVLIRRFAEEEGWAGGFRSCAHWLSWRTGIALGPARERVRVAKALGRLPLISSAMAHGEMSFSKVRALTRKATPENEAALLEVARHATAARTEELIRCWSRVDRLEDARNEDVRHQSRFLQLFPDQEGSYMIRGRLDPEVGAMLEKALEWAAEELYRTEPEGEKEKGGAREPAGTLGQRQADALGLVAERALTVTFDETGRGTAKSPTKAVDSVVSARGARQEDGREPRQPVPQSRGHRFQVVVHVDALDLRAGGTSAGVGSTPPQADHTLEPSSRQGVPAGMPGRGCDHGGSHDTDLMRGKVPAHIVTRRSTVSCISETARRLACDGGVVSMAHASGGGVLNVGRKRRTIPPAIRRALEYRDKGCRFPGCGCRFADAHHVVHWADGGETKLDNLLLVCRRHHRALHEEGFGVEPVAGEGLLGPETTFRFISPDGRIIPDVPAAPPVPKDPVASMVRDHAEADIEPHEWTPTPQWHGEILDYSLAIDMLRGTFPISPGERSRRNTQTRSS